MSFRLKTVLGIALIEAGLLFLLVVSGLGYLRSSNQEALAAKSSTTASLFATTIKQAVIATDLASLDDFMNEVAKYPGLLYAVVADGSGRRLASRGAPGGGLVMAKAEIVEGGIHFGTVEIGFDRQGVEQTVGRAKKVFIAIALAEMVLVGLFSLLLGTHLTRQLKWLESGARRLASGDTAFVIPVRGRDELAATATAFNAMTMAISCAQESLRREHDELMMHKGHLETLVGLKTAELVSAKEGAEAANRSKSAFLATISHEIRTPINAVLGLAHLLEQAELDGEQRDFVAKIALAGRSLLSIINDVLDFSRVEAGRLELDRAPFRLDEVLDELSTIMSVNAGAKDIELVIATDPAVPATLVGDALRLQQVLINLAGNAIKFTQAGEVAVQVVVAARAADRVTLRISVQDTGVGIAADKLLMLFDAFAQADSSTTRHYGGSGLGLAISKRLVELMGGEIGVDSVPGQGSMFWFTLPFELAPARSVEPADRAALDVLVADDNERTRQALWDSVRSLGWRPDCVATGDEAARRVGERSRAGRPYDLLLLDWRMPGMDGLAVARSLRALPGGEQPMVLIMVSASSRDQVVKAADSIHLDAVLAKPVTASGLGNMVEVVRRRRAAAAVPGDNPLPAVDGSRLAGVRVLLADDNQVNQVVAQRILERHGAQVTVVANGREAVDRLAVAGDAFDLVLMDVQMPVMDGYEATRRIHHDLGLAGLPVIALTAGVLEIERSKAVEAGMADFIGKPFTVAEMVRVIRSHLAAPPPIAAEEQAEPPETNPKLA